MTAKINIEKYVKVMW